MGTGVSACLLDTNAFAMVLTDDPRLPAKARAAILAADRAGVSAISFYEIGQKVRLGKWPAMAGVVDRLEALAVEAGFDLIPLSPSVARHAAMLDWAHRDPFDRMIAAAAQEEEVPVVSSDGAFDAVRVERVWE